VVDVDALKRHVAGWAATLLAERSPSESPLVDEAADGLFALELLVPAVLSRTYPMWGAESIDGFRIASVQRPSVRSLTLLGLCVLISDQSVTPCRLSIALADSVSLAEFAIQLGEPGGGPLGVSGPPCNSRLAEVLLAGLSDRAAQIAWVYTATL